MKRTTTLLAAAALIAAMALAGCGGSQTDQAAETATDSLLAANPLEDLPGDITPQEDFELAEAPAPPRKETKPAPKPKPAPPPAPVDPGVTIPAGTPLTMTMSVEVNSEFAKAGDQWTGVITEPVIIGTDAPIPAGSTVNGVVTAAKEAESGDRAMLLLTVTSITVNGKTHNMMASTDSIIAGSTRARNLGAVAGAGAAGALIGKAVGGTKGAVIGGLLGGTAGAVGAAKSKGYQVVLKEGTELTFYVTQDAVVKNKT